MDAKDLRNVVILGHSGSGKTSLGEAALFHTKATTRLGSITDGNTVSDFEPEEVKRGGSVQTTLVSITENDTKINFLDTPGYDDFLGEVISGLNVKRGRVLGMSPDNGITQIEAEVPLAEVQRYAQDLRSVSHGRGTYSLEFDHYDQVPPNLEIKVIEEAKREKLAEAA